MKNYRLQIENRKRETKEALLYALDEMGVGPAGFELLDKNNNPVDQDDYINKYVYFNYYLVKGNIQVEAYVNLKSLHTRAIGGYKVSTDRLTAAYSKISPAYTLKKFYFINTFYKTINTCVYGRYIIKLDEEIIENADKDTLNLYIETAE